MTEIPTLDSFLEEEEEADNKNRKTCSKCYGTGKEVVEVDQTSTVPLKEFRTCEKCEGRGYV